MNLSAFVDLGRQASLVRKNPFFKGSRLSLGIDNALDSFARVRDPDGLTPKRYQEGYLNPYGRLIELRLRKLF